MKIEVSAEIEPHSARNPVFGRFLGFDRQEGPLRREIDAALRAAARTLQAWELPPLLELKDDFESFDKFERLVATVEERAKR